mmetsp:Transcript_13697/g.43269  ORF Transcript_13697/g.43269 Transcript_13697/m.43269 type:complete len:178 (+) Transcript_13697:17-550(+)
MTGPLLFVVAHLLSANALVAVTPATTPTSSRVDAIFAEDARPVVLYDGVCNMCNFWVNFCLDNDPSPGKLRFAALQSDVGRALLERSGRSPDDISSIVLVEPSRASIKADAVLRIGDIIKRTLPLGHLAPLLRLAVPPFLADSVYDLVADNRYRILGYRDTCRVTDDDCADRFLDSF